MLLTARLSAYLFKVGQKLHKGEYVEALMKCPECDTEVVDFTQEQADQHVVIMQEIGDKKLYYCVVGCEGYWVVDPSTLGMPRGNWCPTHEIIKKRLAKYAEQKLGWDIEKLPLEADNAEELVEVMGNDKALDPEKRKEMIQHLEEEFLNN